MKPNVLVIHVDQQRYDCLGFAGNRDVQTPAIDELAADSVIYTNSFCSYPVCTPSRYSLLSGTYSHQHLGWSNRSTLLPGLETFPQLLQAEGYATKAVGKMHFTPTYLDVGFAELELAEQNGHGRFDDDYHRYLLAKGLVDKVDLMDQEMEFRDQAPQAYWESFGALESQLSAEDHSTTWIGSKAMAALENWTEQGSCLMVGFIKPHHPFDPPAPWSGMYDPSALQLLDGWTDQCLAVDQRRGSGYFDNTLLHEAALRQVMAYYYAAISQIDHEIGRMIAILKAKGIYDNTMIVFTSDHGDYLGYHHMLLKNNHMYEPLVRVPLLIKYPESSRTGSDHRLVSNVDVAPTILGAVGCQPGPYMGGLDLLDETQARGYVVTENRMGAEYMIRDQRYKLLLAAAPDDSLFFDLEADPLELTNLFAEPGCQSQVRRLREALGHWLLFETPVPTFVQEDAAIVDTPNALDADEGRREKVRQRVRELYGR